MPSDPMQGERPWTVMALLQWTTDYFTRHRLDTPRMDAEILLAHSLGCRRIDLYLRHDQPLHPSELARFKALIKRRINREPVAYIVGCKEFWSLPLEVTPAVLIPRSDTECLVAAALGHLPVDAAVHPRRVLELGVGSGAVTVVLAHERPGHRFWASDVSWPAVRVARANARRHGVAGEIAFFVGRWLAPVSAIGGAFDLIVSNPPYVRWGDLARVAPEIREFEPRCALDGGQDGLAAIGTIIAAAVSHLRPDGLLLLEIGWDQRDAVAALARATGGYHPVQFHKDYAGHHRVAQMQKKS